MPAAWYNATGMDGREGDWKPSAGLRALRVRHARLIGQIRERFCGWDSLG